MIIRVIEPPKDFLPLDRAKAHLNVEPEDVEFDELISAYIAAAASWLDGPDGWLGRCLGEQVLELSACSLTGMRLPLPPVIEVISITCTGSDGVERSLAAADYRLLPDGALWVRNVPSVSGAPDSVKVRYRAGYPDIVTPPESEEGEEQREPTVPKPIQQAVLLLVGQWFKTRENVITGTIATAMPFSVEALLSPYRVWR